MTAKEYLSQAFYIDLHINAKIEQKEELRELALKTTTHITGMPGSPNRNTDRLENTVVKIVDLENEINDEIDRLIDLKADISRRIQEVDDNDCRLLLELRYLSFKRWKDIAEQMHCSLRNVHKIHEKALEKICLP